MFLSFFLSCARAREKNIFALLQEAGRPNRFAIVEGWKDQSAFDAHEKAMSTTQFPEALKAIRNSPPNQHVLHAFAPLRRIMSKLGGL